MAVLVPDDKLPDLMTLMESQLPESIEIYGLLKTSVSGDWPFYTFWVDQWPNATAVVATPKYQLLDDFSATFHFLHGQEGCVVTKILQHPGVINWSRDISFVCDIHLLSSLQAAVPTDKGQLSVQSSGNTYIVTKTTLKTEKLPDDVILDHVTHDLIPTIVENWIFKDPGVKDYLQRLVSTNLPKICVRTSRDREMCAYALVQPHNMIGMVFVEPRFRRRGLGRLLVSHMAQQLLMTSPVAAAEVVQENVKSQNLLKSSGFESRTEHVRVNYSVSWQQV